MLAEEIVDSLGQIAAIEALGIGFGDFTQSAGMVWQTHNIAGPGVRHPW